MQFFEMQLRITDGCPGDDAWMQNTYIANHISLLLIAKMLKRARRIMSSIIHGNFSSHSKISIWIIGFNLQVKTFITNWIIYLVDDLSLNIYDLCHQKFIQFIILKYLAKYLM